MEPLYFIHFQRTVIRACLFFIFLYKLVNKIFLHYGFRLYGASLLYKFAAQRPTRMPILILWYKLVNTIFPHFCIRLYGSSLCTFAAHHHTRMPFLILLYKLVNKRFPHFLFVFMEPLYFIHFQRTVIRACLSSFLI